MNRSTGIEPETNRTKTNWKKELGEWGRSIGTVAIVAGLIYSFLGAPYAVHGESMMATLHNNERVVVNKAIYHLQQPDRGDIVVFHATPTEDYIKRVIGLEGDRVEVVDDVLYINGEAVDEPYLAEKRKEAADMGLPLTENVAPVTVPPGHVFVMGDNRRNSRDSRELGPIPLEQLVGRTELVYWPFTDIRLAH
ncbi:signal peptidase I [Brevibacillus dissolubilis]|uniref:signal peptidase I n=1 Tax=Brevibacillus dissolubilis TaxID=1844116 RepID=UPI00111619DA|nr:signal peptidase I [Brevibacillus dissolubilis]